MQTSAGTRTKRHPLSKPKTQNKTSRETVYLPAVVACEVLLRLPQSSTIILSSGSSVSCFCWLTPCPLHFPSASGASLHGACTHTDTHIGSRGLFRDTVSKTGLLHVWRKTEQCDDRSHQHKALDLSLKQHFSNNHTHI